jgi:hypothetical protein
MSVITLSLSLSLSLNTADPIRTEKIKKIEEKRNELTISVFQASYVTFDGHLF